MGTAAEVSVTRAQALAHRLGRHLLDPVGTTSVADVVRCLGAVPSMDAALAELAVRTRRATSRPGELAAAVQDGTVVMAFAFRGAVHHLSAADGGAYLALRAAGRQWERRSWVEYYGLAPSDWPDFRATVRDALAEGPLTVTELGEVVAARPAFRHLAPVFAEGAGTLVKPLTWQGDMVLGPPRDGRATVRRVDDNPHWRGIPDLEEAGPHVLSAFLGTYGPVTPENVQHWLGDGLSAGRRRIERWLAGLGDRLVTVDVEGTTAHVLREDADALAAAAPSDVVRLLPGHDQWVMGPGTADTLVVPPDRRDVVTRKANLVVVGGVVAGTWARHGHTLAVTWLDTTAPRRAPLEAEVERLAGILGTGLALDLRVG